jgi:hypothetical protein
MAAYTKTLHVGVTDVLAGHSVLCCLSTSSSSSLTSAISATKRLFMDSGGLPGVPRLVLHQCSSPLNRVCRDFRLYSPGDPPVTVEQARHRMSEVSSRGDAGGWTAQFSIALDKVAVCEPLTTDRSTPRSERAWSRPILSGACSVSELPRVNRFSTTGHALSTRCCGSARPGVLTHPFGPRQQGLLPRECLGHKQRDRRSLVRARDRRVFSANAVCPHLVSDHEALRLGQARFPARARTASKDSLLGSADGGPMASGTKPGAMGFPRRGRLGRARSSGVWGPETDKSYPPHVAVLPGGALPPAPFGPHQQGPPPWERPGSKQGPTGSWQNGGTPWIPPNQQSIHPLSE